jgi:hypothetical protein
MYHSTRLPDMGTNGVCSRCGQEAARRGTSVTETGERGPAVEPQCMATSSLAPISRRTFVRVIELYTRRGYALSQNSSRLPMACGMRQCACMPRTASLVPADAIVTRCELFYNFRPVQHAGAMSSYCFFASAALGRAQIAVCHDTAGRRGTDVCTDACPPRSAQVARVPLVGCHAWLCTTPQQHSGSTATPVPALAVMLASRAALSAAKTASSKAPGKMAAVGAKWPSVTLFENTPGGKVPTDDLVKGKKVRRGVAVRGLWGGRGEGAGRGARQIFQPLATEGGRILPRLHSPYTALIKPPSLRPSAGCGVRRARRLHTHVQQFAPAQYVAACAVIHGMAAAARRDVRATLTSTLSHHRCRRCSRRLPEAL